jgi:hypothetical protein
MSYYSDRESFGLVPETCPFVDKAMSTLYDEVDDIIDSVFDDTTQSRSRIRSALQSSIDSAAEAVKVQTVALRTALGDTLDEKLKLESYLSDMESNFSDSEDSNKELTNEVERLEGIISDLKY